MRWLILILSVQCAALGQSLDDGSRYAEEHLLLIDDRVDHSVWGELLAENVREGRVDYTAIGASTDDLAAYLSRLSGVETSVLSRDELLAYYINLYNATMIQAVIDRYHDGYTPAESDFAVFKEKLVHLNSRELSLNELENDIIRKEFREPRIHVALVCAAESCPPLLPRVYQAEDLDQVLEDNMRRFVNDPVRNPIDHQKKQARLSKIFDWYADDFGGRDRLIEYLNRYSDVDLTGYEVSFVEYSWKLNNAGEP